MKLTKDDFTDWSDKYSDELIIKTSNPKELADQILKDQEDAESGRIWNKTLPNLPHEYNKYLAVYKRLEKEIQNAKDHKRPLYHYTESNANAQLVLDILQKIQGKEKP